MNSNFNNTLAPSANGRQREVTTGGEEAAAELLLGEFNGVPSLSLSEARLLINAVIDHRQKTNRKMQEGDTLRSTQKWLDEFARFKQKENIEAVERLLAGRAEFEPFERSQLGSLCCDTSEEAKTLIPSITHKISDDDLQELLDNITSLRTFVE
ncbi:HRDC-like protein [Cryomyces antarcticus]|nr:hypothetical protein LTR04_000426 [Oleoguttula sp. CCFEE 6159]